MRALEPIVVAATILVPIAASGMTDHERGNAIGALPWAPAGTYRLLASSSSVAVPEGYAVVLGDNVRRLVTLLDAVDDPNVEAVVRRGSRSFTWRAGCSSRRWTVRRTRSSGPSRPPRAPMEEWPTRSPCASVVTALRS
jgi:hypothetical protein